MASPVHSRRLHVLGGHLKSIDGVHSSHQDHSFLDIHSTRSIRIPDHVTNKLAVFIGGIIMDVQATPNPGQSLYQGGSVMGHIKFIPGGVARNIIQTLQALVSSSTTLLLISAIGNDHSGTSLLQHTQSLGLRTDGIITMPHGRTPTVSIIFNGTNGDVDASVADVDLLEQNLTIERVMLYRDELMNAKMILLDGDISTETLTEVCRLVKSNTRHQKPLIWFEPVSVPKAQRASHVLNCIDFISPNIDELKSIAQPLLLLSSSNTIDNNNHDTNTDNDILLNTSSEAILKSVKKELYAVLNTGLKYVVLTLGPQGAALCWLDNTRVHVYQVPAVDATVVNCSGAGDCLVAGCMYALLELNATAESALEYGVAAAKEAIESESNVPGVIHASRLKETMVKMNLKRRFVL